VVARFRDWQYDRRIGIHTGGDVSYLQFSDDTLHRFAQDYQATSPEVFDKIMRSVGCLTAPFTFIDVGCGKGRVLLMAAQHSFKRVIGVEFNSELVRIAEMNVAKFQSRSDCQNRVDVVCEDAAQYQFPDENAVIFFFNPF
jgi:predicted RNA methylase